MGAGVALQALGLGYQVGNAIGTAIKGSGRAGGPAGVRGLTKNQQLFNLSTQNILEMEQMMLTNAASEGNAVNAEIYRMLGYEPQYSNDAPDPAALKEGANAAFSESVTAYTDWQKAKQRYERAKAAAGSSHGTSWAKVLATGGMEGFAKGQPKARAARAAAQELKSANARLSMARSSYASKRDAYQSALINPRQVIGMTPLAPPSADSQNPDDQMRIALKLGNESLLRALKGEEPIDKTLVHAYEVGEQNLRERLRRTLGPDYETSTAGAQALNDFTRTKGEAFQQFNRQTIDFFTRMTDQEATTLGNLTSQRINQLLTPSDESLKIAAALGAGATERTNYITAQANRYAQQAGLNVQGFNASTARQAADTQSRELQIGTTKYLADTVGGALVSGGDALSQYLGARDTRSQTATDAYAVDNPNTAFDPKQIGL